MTEMVVKLNSTLAAIISIIIILAICITNLVLVLNIRGRVATHEEVLRQHSPILQQIVQAAQAQAQRNASLTPPSPGGTPSIGDGPGVPGQSVSPVESD